MTFLLNGNVVNDFTGFSKTLLWTGDQEVVFAPDEDQDFNTL